MATELGLSGAGSAPGLRLPNARPQRLLARAWARANAPVDSASLVAFRVLFGLTMFVAVVRFSAHGWIHQYFIEPRYFFGYWGLDFIRPWPGWGMYAHFALMAVCALTLACGVRPRTSALLFGLCFTWAHLIDQSHYLNHYYLVSLFSLLLVLLPAASTAPVTPRSGPTAPAAVVPQWVVWALRTQVGLVYFFGGLGKLQADWLLHAQPLRLWLSASPDFPFFGALLDHDAVAFAFSWAGAVFDLGIVAFLCLTRTRAFAFAALVLFHGVTGLLFNIGIFPWLMTLAALVFWPPDWPRALSRKLRAALGRELPSPAGIRAKQPLAPWSATPPYSLAALAVAVLLGVQCLLPLRHLAYPGNHLWTEQGFRYSWNVMVMEKSGSAEFEVREPASKRSWLVQPRDELTRYQARVMTSSPEMLLAYARHLAQRFRARGVRAPQVFVRAEASLNGRPARPLVDPTLDLSQQREGLAHKTWILPAPSDSPP